MAALPFARCGATSALLILSSTACSTWAPEPRLSFEEKIGRVDLLLRATNPRDVSWHMTELDLPETEEHHAALLQALRSVPEIDTDHLLLLTHAAAPGAQRLSPGTSFFINNRRITTARAPRGAGPFAHVVDQLLREGTAKLVDVNRFNAGRLIGRTETLEAMLELSDRFLPRVDDGSPAALREILVGFNESLPDSVVTWTSGNTTTTISGSNNAKAEFITEVLFHRGLAEGERELVALKALTGTSRRLRVLQGRLAQRETIDAATFGTYLELLSGTSSRLQLLEDHVQRLQGMDHEDAVQLARTLSGSSSRIEILPWLVRQVEAPLDHRALRSYLKCASGSSSRLELLEDLGSNFRFESADDLANTLRLFSGSSSRLEALETTLERSKLQLSGKEMRALVALYSGTSSRLEAIDLTECYVQRPIEASAAVSLMKLMSSTSSKIEVLRKLKDDYMTLPQRDRERIVKQFSSRSGREKARRLLGLESDC